MWKDILSNSAVPVYSDFNGPREPELVSWVKFQTNNLIAQMRQASLQMMNQLKRIPKMTKAQIRSRQTKFLTMILLVVERTVISRIGISSQPCTSQIWLH